MICSWRWYRKMMRDRNVETQYNICYWGSIALFSHGVDKFSQTSRCKKIPLMENYCVKIVIMSFTKINHTVQLFPSHRSTLPKTYPVSSDNRDMKILTPFDMFICSLIYLLICLFQCQISQVWFETSFLPKVYLIQQVKNILNSKTKRKWLLWKKRRELKGRSNEAVDMGS